MASGTLLRDDQYTWTDVDRAAAFEDATRRLIRDGRRQVVFLDCEVHHTHLPEKQAGFLKGVRDELGRDGKRWMFASGGSSYDDVVSLTQKAVRRMPEARAFLLTDNFYAAAVEHALRREGLHPGADCRVIGFGDTALADRCTPRLSHYSLQVERQVEFGIGALLEEIQNPDAFQPRHQLFGPEFIERDT